MKREDTSLEEQISSEEYNDEEKLLKSIVSEGMMNPRMRRYVSQKTKIS